MLADDLQTDRTLAGDDLGIVKRMDEDRAGFGLDPAGLGIGFIETFAVQHDIAAAGADGGDLDGRGGHRHDDGGGDPAPGGGQGDPLGVVAGRGADHAT